MYSLPRKRSEPVTKPIQLSVSQCPDRESTRGAASLMNGLLEAIVDGPLNEPVEELRVVIRSPTGETAYKAFRVVSTDCPSHRSSAKVSSTGIRNDPEI